MTSVSPCLQGKINGEDGVRQGIIERVRAKVGRCRLSLSNPC